MRTKKILSVLLAMIMTLGTFGIFAFAEEEEAVLQGKLSEMVNGFPLTENKSLSGNVGETAVVWTSFTAEDGTTTGAESFKTLYDADQADCEWIVYRVLSTGVRQELRTDYGDAVAAKAADGVWFSVTQTTVNCYIGQTATPWYGTLEVQLTVKKGASEWTSAVKTIELVNPKPLLDKILEAEKYDKDDRYTAAYLANLRFVLGEAKVVAKNPTPAQVTLYTGYLDQCIKGQYEGMAPVTKIYKFTGWEWLDNLMPDGMLKVLWGIRDVFTPLVNFFGQIGAFFKNILPFFTMLFGLIG